MDYTHGRNTLSAAIDAGFDESRRIKISNSATYNSNRNEVSLIGQAKLEVPFKVRKQGGDARTKGESFTVYMLP